MPGAKAEAEASVPRTKPINSMMALFVCGRRMHTDYMLRLIDVLGLDVLTSFGG